LTEKLLQPPRLWNPETHGHRRVTWIELFFDLIFVAAVAEVGTPLEADYTLHGLLRYGFLFLLIWWAWLGHTFFATRFDCDDLVQRFLVLLQCFIAAVMAVNAGDALDSRSSAGFGAAYAGMRILLAIQYWRARAIPPTRSLTTRHAGGFAVAALLWLISAFFEPPVRYWLWLVSAFLDFATPWLAARHLEKAPPDANHLPERFSLFTIILIGEFVAAVMRGIKSHENWSVPAAAAAFSGVAFALLLAWWYFEIAHGESPRHVRSRRQARIFQLWQHAHLAFFAGVAVAGVGFQKAIAHADSQLDGGSARLLCSAVAISIVSINVIGAMTERTQRERPLLLYLAVPAACLADSLLASSSPAGMMITLLATGIASGFYSHYCSSVPQEIRSIGPGSTISGDH
jgi:low temperature requirement protein LtrA